MAKVRVDYYENNSARKKKEILGTFVVQVEPREVKPVNEELKGKALERDKARYAEEVDKADLELRTKALDKIHEITGWTGILVANVIPEKEEV